MNARESIQYDGRAVANFVLDFCEKRKRNVTNLSLQKIVYFCHVWALVRLGRPLIKHQFEAWQYGPVLQYLYTEFRRFDDSPITSRSMEIDHMSGVRKVAKYNFDNEIKDMVEEVVDFYSRLSSSDLVGLSHARGGPWDRVWNHEGRVNPGMKIGNDMIVAYYSKVPTPYQTQ